MSLIRKNADIKNNDYHDVPASYYSLLRTVTVATGTLQLLLLFLMQMQRL